MGRFAGYEWDPLQAAANRRRHGVDLADAVAVFEDERAVTIRAELTAVDEQRWLTVGRDARSRILVIAYTWRKDRIRVISARRATAGERRPYLGEER